MLAYLFGSAPPKSHIIFACGLCFVILFGWMPLIPNIQTFMFTWRVELASAVFIVSASAYLFYSGKFDSFQNNQSAAEKFLILLPLLAFILWSGFSVFWAYSWKSALFHTAIWSQYLVFYLIVRQLLDFDGNFRLMMILLTVMLIIIGLPAIIEYCSFLYFNAGTSLGIRFSKYAEIINLLCPLITAAVLRMNNLRFKIGLFCITVLWLFIISTISRTGFILFIAGVLTLAAPIFILTQFKKYRRKMAYLLLALVISPIPLHLIAFLSPEPNVPIATRATASEGSNNFRKMLLNVSLEMVETNFVYGVGAGNFGTEFNKYRIAYGEKNPDDINLTAGESEIPERAHNEYLQIFAELGIVGGLIFLCFLSVIALMTVKLFRRRNEVSLFPFAALCAIYLFIISSAVSSYSFRLVQNGFIFFFVLAVASKLLLKKEKDGSQSHILLPSNFYKAVLACGIVAGLFLGTISVFRALSAFYSDQIYNLSDSANAEKLYQNAVFYDGENPLAYSGYGRYLINEKRYAEAAPEFRKSIDYGESTSANYSLLATAQRLAGAQTAAAATFAEASKAYPRSTFVRTRYAELLRQTDNPAESQRQLNISLLIDEKSTKTWWSLIHEGVAKTNLKTVKDADFILVFDLEPQLSYNAFMIERLILHPEEKPRFVTPENRKP